MKEVDNLMQRAIVEHVFPGAVLLVSKDNAIRFEKAYGYADIFSKTRMTTGTVFDLASLTKPLATTLAVMELVEHERLELDQDLGSVLHEFDPNEKNHVTVRHLLSHSSGLADYRPFYRQLTKDPIERRKETLHHLLLQEPLIYPTGEKTLYSDIGFMMLQWVVERISGNRLDHFLSREIYSPLGVKADSDPGLFFVDLTSPMIQNRKMRFAATERCPLRNILLTGAVHDENAYAMGGIAGHAGLFGTARSVHALLQELLAGYHGGAGTCIFQKDLLRTFFKEQPGTNRALGFDMPSLPEASCGKYFSRKSIGHLGFTGTSFWVDPDQSIIVILLSNRVHPSRHNFKIKRFRPVIHDAVMENI